MNISYPIFNLIFRPTPPPFPSFFFGWPPLPSQFFSSAPPPKSNQPPLSLKKWTVPYCFNFLVGSCTFFVFLSADENSNNRRYISFIIVFTLLLRLNWSLSKQRQLYWGGEESARRTISRLFSPPISHPCPVLIFYSWNTSRGLYGKQRPKSPSPTSLSDRTVIL